MVEKNNLRNQLAKTQKILPIETPIIQPGTRDAQARKLIQDYAKIELALKLVKRFSPLNPLIFILIKKRLARAVQQEFDLYRSLPELVKEGKMKSSAEIVSSNLQQELYKNSQIVDVKLNDLMEKNMIKIKYVKEVYSFKLPPIKTRTKTKKFSSVFTSANMKKKFS